MTVQATTRKAGPFLGNGATVFSFAFKIFDKTNIQVILTDTFGNLSTLGLDSDYSVTVNADQNNNPGGSVTYPLAIGYKLTIIGSLPYTQPTDITNSGGFYPQVIEDALDRAEIQIQQAEEQIGRALSVAPSDAAIPPLPAAAQRVNRTLVFDANGNPGVSAQPYTDPATILNQANANAAALVAGISPPIFTGWFPTTLIAGVDFTPGTSTSVLLPATTGAKVIMGAFFDGGFQSDWVLGGDNRTLTFGSAIPLYTQQVVVWYAAAFYLGNFIANGIGAVPRPFQSKMQESVSVEDFGASVSAVDNSLAVAAAFTYCAASGRTLRVPGTYKVKQKFVSTQPISIIGEGAAQSGFVWTTDAASSGIDITIPASLIGLASTVTMRDFSLMTAQAGLGVALKVTSAPSTASDRITSRAFVQNVTVRGLTNPTVDGWNTGLFFDNCTGVVVDSYTFWGKVGAGGQPNYDSVYGIRYDNTIAAAPHPTEFAFTKCIIQCAKTGIHSNDFEGGYVADSQIVGVNAGIRFLTPGPGYPHAIAHDNHINADSLCIDVGGMYEVFIHDNLLYNQLTAGAAGSGVTLHAGAQFCNIHDNTFECYNNSISMTGIIIDSASNCLVNGNIFRRTDSIDGTQHGVGVWLTTNSASVRVGNQQLYVATTGTNVLNQGTGNTVVP